MTQPVDLSPWEWRIIVGGLKGGLGKTTSAWMLALALARRTGDTVLAVDADPKSQTLADSYRTALARGQKVPFAVSPWPTPDGLVTGVRAEKHKLGARHLVVDTGGDTERILEQACLLGIDEDGRDIGEFIIPVAPNQPDPRRIPATLGVAARIVSLTVINPTILLTACDSSAGDAPAARAWMGHPDRQWPLLASQVPDTVLYKRALYQVPDTVGVYDDVLDELAALRMMESTR